MTSQQETQKLRETRSARGGVHLETIETELNNLFTKDFAGFTRSRSPTGGSVAWLRSEFRRKDQT